MKQLAILLCTLFCACAVWAQSGEEQAKRQARSVHLSYHGWQGPATVFYSEMTVDRFAPGSYAAIIAFDGGYAGVQELPHGERVAIFSVWEPGDIDLGADPNAVALAERTKPLYHGEFVHVQRFGNEGTGGKSMVGYKWENGKPVIMAISAKPDGERRTAYTCWIWIPEMDGWFQMATFSSLVGKGKAELTGPYAFLEDFRRNVESKSQVRTARVSRLWAYNGKTWSASPVAQFTADNNILTTIDAGPSAEGFWMATGGAIQNVTTPLYQRIKAGGTPDTSEARREKLLKAIEAQR